MSSTPTGLPSSITNHISSTDAVVDEKHPPDIDEQPSAQPKFQIFVGMDFGTDGSGLAYALEDGQTYIHNLWKDVGSTEKPKTSVLFDNNGDVQCHGNQAVIQYISSMNNKGWKLFERFKMTLYEYPSWKTDIRPKMCLTKSVELKEEIPSTNNDYESEASEKVFVAHLKFLKNEAMTFIQRNFKRKKKLQFTQDEIQWILTVPAIWSDKAKQTMKNWAIKAGVAQDNIPNQLKIVYEPDCASLSIQHALLRNLNQITGTDDEKTELHGTRSPKERKKKKKCILQPHRPHININVPFKEGDKYILLDVGGGTCDIACHEIMQSSDSNVFAIAEVLHSSGGPWGSCNIDRQFESLLNDIFSDEWMDDFKENWPSIYQQLLQNFITVSKISFYDDKNKPTRRFLLPFHSVELPSSFGDFLLLKLEQNNNNTQDDMSDHDPEEMLDNYLKQRCIELYSSHDLLEIQELSRHGSYQLSLHFKLWKQLFDIVVDPIIAHIENILAHSCMKDCSYIFLVGGFANSKYFQERIQDTFSEATQIVIPQIPQLCVVDGAARYGLNPKFMKVRRLAHSYGIQTNKPLQALTHCLDLFPKGFLKDNTYFDDELQKTYVKECFCVFGTKNKPINIDDKAIRKAVYKMAKDQRTMMIEIFQSDKEEPMTTSQEGSEKIGKLVIHLPDSDEYQVWVEFKWSDTMLVVLSYPNNRRDLKCESIVQYN